MVDRANVSYPPLNTLKPVAEDVWIADGEPLRPLGLPMPIRMTVIRLESGDFWLHSPIRFDAGLLSEMERLGRIRHLIAPNIAHWSFVGEWQQHCPAALTWAAPNLRRRWQVRKAGLRIDRDLGDEPPADWTAEIAQTIIPGGGGFREAAFLHRKTQTLLLTDLVVNLEPMKLPRRTRAFARLTGMLAPDGKAPTYLRLLVRMHRKDAVAALSEVIGWAPERVIFAHGRWFECHGTERLKRSLAWLLG